MELTLKCDLFSCRIVMASSCIQRCLQCRSLLCSGTVANTWLYSAQLHHFTATCLPLKIPNGSSVIRENDRTTQARERWKQKVVFYSDLTAKHLATEAKEDKNAEEPSRADIVAYKSPLLPMKDAVPVNESQMSLGTHWFAIVDHSNLFVKH